ncbi:hypothetical protein [Sphingomonas dokdonensis]|uniref:DUF2834 domain-containing protein n=1 Tax=Sphingomonas dokdonensis TaxID=344880 RepID=A0A245ZNL2_9SPHN|nr:hypothetical protein [Sphingomonas dokdonensis]OWK31322.1 hypothetical protein SPDO_13300 [Sphingomonas dokdonensis]
MTGFRVLLIAMWIVLVGYTALVIAGHGMGLLPIFFGDMARLTWPGQFNLDFLCFLILSATWTAWRARFAAHGLLLAPVALLGGAGFLLPYLLFLTIAARGDMRRVLLGDRA